MMEKAKKILKKFSNEKFQFKLLFWFLVLQPFLDCFLLYSEEVISFFHFSPTTIIRLLFISLLSLIIFFADKSKKSKIIMVIYGIVMLIYTILHHIYCSGLNIVNYNEFVYNTTTELFYILRMMLPIAMIYLGFQIKYTKEEFIKVVTRTITVVSCIIIALNITKISLASYGGGQISGNIFDWFFSIGKYGPQNLASKGWFNSANQISGLFMLLLPFAVYDLFDKFTYKKVFSISASVIAMTMLGTRVATYGWLLIIIMIVIIDLYMILIHKHKIKKESYITVLIISIVGLVLGFFAPVVSSEMVEVYNQNDSQAESSIDKIYELSQRLKTEDLSEKERKKLIKDYDCILINGDLEIDCLVEKLSIAPAYYKEIYPVKDHEDFWAHFMFEIPLAEKMGQRNIQSIIAKDIDSNQKQNLTPLLGYGYSRFINAYLYPENDYYVHYLTIGTAGVILLLCVYPIVALASALYMLIKRKFNFLNLLLCAAILETIAVSYVTGHIMDELIVSLFLGFITGFLLKRMKEINNEKNKY